MNSLAYSLLLIGAANAAPATALDADVGCTLAAVAADTSNADYSKAVVIEAKASTVDAKTCFTAVSAIDASATAAANYKEKRACAQTRPDATTATDITCEIIHEVKATATTWDPRDCKKTYSAGVVTFGAASTHVWDPVATTAQKCAAATTTTTDTKEAGAASMTAGFAAVAMALFVNM